MALIDVKRFPFGPVAFAVLFFGMAQGLFHLRLVSVVKSQCTLFGAGVLAAEVIPLSHGLATVVAAADVFVVGVKSSIFLRLSSVIVSQFCPFYNFDMIITDLSQFIQ